MSENKTLNLSIQERVLDLNNSEAVLMKKNEAAREIRRKYDYEWTDEEL